MKIFVDTANLEEIKKLNDWKLINGVTTNPSLIAKSDRDFKQAIIEICSIVDGPVSAEVIAVDCEEMVKEGQALSRLHRNVVVKLPLTKDGLKAIHVLSQQQIKTNATLVFSAVQALLAAKAGATYVSPFIGRLDDIGENGMKLVEDIITIYNHYGFDTQVLVASIRNLDHVYKATVLGAHCVTCPSHIIYQLLEHPLTNIGLKKFLDDWNNSNKKI